MKIEFERKCCSRWTHDITKQTYQEKKESTFLGAGWGGVLKEAMFMRERVVGGSNICVKKRVAFIMLPWVSFTEPSWHSCFGIQSLIHITNPCFKCNILFTNILTLHSSNPSCE